MAKKYGQEVKMTGFTRGGAPVGKRTGAKSKGKAPSGTGNGGFSPAELAAIGLAGGLTAGAGALIGAGLRKGLGKR